MGEGPDPAAGTPESTQREIARLVAERDQLRAELGERRAPSPTAAPRAPGRPRRIAAVALVVVTSIVFTVAVAGVWARRNALNTDKWVDTVGPIGEDPAVQQALAELDDH